MNMTLAQPGAGVNERAMALQGDAGISAPGSVATGLQVARICLGGLGEVRLSSGAREGWPTWVEVASANPVLACLGSQYAGWSLAASKEETGGKKFFSLGSGPARALAGKEALFAELGYRDRAAAGVLVLAVRGDDGTFSANPDPALVLHAGNVIIAVGTADALAVLQKVCA